MNGDMWMVRAGQAGAAIKEFRAKGIVAIGWARASTNWTEYVTLMAIEQRLAQLYPEKTSAQNRAAANQIERFLRKISVGHGVLTYDPVNKNLVVGLIHSIPRYDVDLIPELPTYRHVSWQGHLPKDQLSLPSRNVLGAIQTLFRVPDRVTAEILQRYRRQVDP